MVQFMIGVIATEYLIGGVFFLRFWSETRDRLFLLFAVAFSVLACNRMVMVFQHGAEEAHMAFYLVRFLAFALILACIIDKNRSSRAT